MPLLCLRLLSEAREEEGGWSLAAEWLVRNDDGSSRGRGVTDYRGLLDLLDPTQDWIHNPDNVVLLVPHDQVLEVSVTVPGRSAAQMRRALPFAVEEFTTADIETLHIASDTIRPGRPVRCQLLDRTLLENWLSCLRSLGIEPGFLLADTELLPLIDNATHVLVDGPAALIRSPDEAATVDRSNLLLALQSLSPALLRMANGRLEPLEAAQLPDTQVTYVDSAETGIEYLISNWRRDESINLLQGSYAPVRRNSEGSGAWRQVAAFAASWVVLAWLLMVGEGLWAAHRTKSFDTQARALYSEWFPDESNVRNVRRALAGKLGQSTGDGGPGFAQLTADLATALEGSASLRSLEFEQQNGELKAEIVLENHAMVEALNSRLAALGVESQLQSATQDQSLIRAYFVLRRAS